jgi:hypothetical protein
MPPRSDEEHKHNPAAFDDDWGACIRRGLLKSVQDQQPGDNVWARILQRIQEHDWPPMSDPASHGAPSPLAHLLQAVVVSTLLLTFVFGADHGPPAPRHNRDVVGPTPVSRRAVSPIEFQEDMLRGHVLMRMEKQSLSRRGGYARGTRSPP